MVQFDYIGHASILASCDGFTLMTDPWFGKPISGGVVRCYPPMKIPSPEVFDRINAVHISHAHYDHICREAMAPLSRRTPIIIANYRDKRLLQRIRDFGFEEIIEVVPGPEGIQIGPFQVCSFLPPVFDGSFDSALVLRAGNENFLFNNDCMLTHAMYQTIHCCFGDFAGCWVGYSNIEPFPSCFDFSECRNFRVRTEVSDILERGRKYSWSHVSMICEILRPKWVVPYAGGIRFLNRDFSHLNKIFYSPEEIFSTPTFGAEAKVLWPGDSISSDGKAKNLHLTKDPMQIPSEALLPALFPNAFSENDLERRRVDYEALFLNLIGRQVEFWLLPMTIQFVVKGKDAAIAFEYSFDGKDIAVCADQKRDVDLVIEYSAPTLERILARELGFVRAHREFLFHARVLKFIPGQTGVTRWRD